MFALIGNYISANKKVDYFNERADDLNAIINERNRTQIYDDTIRKEPHFPIWYIFRPDLVKARVHNMSNLLVQTEILYKYY